MLARDRVMATANDSDDYDEVGVTEITLEELVTTNPLPQRAKVTSGFDDPHNPENSFSTGDVIEVRSVSCELELYYKCKPNH